MKRFLTLFCIIGSLSSCYCEDSVDVEDSSVLPGVFSFTEDEFNNTLQNLPKDISLSILARKELFLSVLDQVLNYPKETFLIADKQHFLPEGYAPDDIVSLNEFPLKRSRNDLSLRRIIMPDVMALDTACGNAGLTLLFSSTYRSYEYQDTVYKRNVRQLGKEAADRESARPGTSQHQLGTAIDFGSITDAFGSTPEGIWLFDHGWEYGFSLSYPQGYEQLTGYRHESWHYRWIGRPAAQIVHVFFDDIQHYFLYYINENWDWLQSGRL